MYFLTAFWNALRSFFSGKLFFYENQDGGKSYEIPYWIAFFVLFFLIKILASFLYRSLRMRVFKILT